MKDDQPRRWRLRPTWSTWLDLGLMLSVFYLATRLRTNWVDVQINADWPFYFRFANELGNKQEMSESVLYLYTSIPSLFFAAVTQLLDDPWHILRFWAMVGALAAPLSYLAARRLAGPPAGFAVGLLVATSAGDIHVLTGLETPGPISLFTALATLGLVAGAQRRPWGPPILILGTAMAVCHHVGLWPMAPLACLLAALHLIRLPRRTAFVSATVAIVVGGLISAIMLALDATRLLEETSSYDSSAPHFASGLITDDASAAPPSGLLRTSFEILVTQRHVLGEKSQFGLNAPPSVAMLFLLTTLAGCVSFGVSALRQIRRRKTRGPARDWSRLDISSTAVQLVVLFGAGLTPYMSMATSHGYLSATHMVAFLPLAAVAMVACSAACVPPRFSMLQATIPALLVWAWLGIVECAPARRTPIGSAFSFGLGSSGSLFEHRGGSTRFDIDPCHSFNLAAGVSEVIRTDARDRGKRPVVFGWFDPIACGEPGLLTNVIQELSLASWVTSGLQPACYLVVAERDAELVGFGRLLPLEPNWPFAAFAYEEREDLTSLEEWLCDPESHRVVFRRHDRQRTHSPVLFCARETY